MFGCGMQVLSKTLGVTLFSILHPDGTYHGYDIYAPLFIHSEIKVDYVICRRLVSILVFNYQAPRIIFNALKLELPNTQYR